jgi:S-adenosylmethionine:tRNA ribosyltransferase-isomerase
MITLSTTETLNLFSLEAYDYHLPEQLIAKYPLPQRSASKMMHISRETQTWEHKHFTDLVAWLQSEDLLVINNTKVLPARIFGNRRGYEGKVEVLLLHPTGNEADTEALTWNCLLKPIKKLKEGTLIELPNTTSVLEVMARQGLGHGVVKAHLLGGEASMNELMEKVGELPIPPYFARRAEAIDKERYQTVYNKVEGSQAAPTAGLHFTPEVLEAIRAKGVTISEVTLSVGAGTFRPVQVDDIRQHAMHAEWYTLPQETVDAITATKANGGRVVAVGTTSVKTLETAIRKQAGTLTQADTGWSELFIYPGIEFQVVDAMLTNFHLPKSTLMMLVSAFANRELMLSAYEDAVAQAYRFYSYGDCMLIA